MDLTNADWRKSSYSSSNGGNCIEVAQNLSGFVAVRDSKDPHGAALTVSPVAWRSFLAGVRAGRLGRRPA